ncbi:hypothetical protein M3Y99_01295100 [Aphelenchoides fujianensis]|nr:hypothetical protein M3Y99_01295100 [Aphelenchoides fujianensis]
MVYTEPGEATIAKNMPCCRESIGSHVCQEMKQRRPYEFKMRCRTDIDFRRPPMLPLMPHECSELFAHGPSSRHCFDRHNRRFCTAFVRKSGMWSSYSDIHSGCNGENAALAFSRLQAFVADSAASNSTKR